ncbi:hypothetical protein BP5796_04709 [Coleophoma crateriformis]|uniref:DUF4045 domain-containing protein n=1 Tax=Coleophoma crateriformis TaxID=565419 RepID=A0A3D8SBT6_9HELO|nr:hypothetical protein BP5796_04709 [Coleophoma crateriformis]
MSTSAADGSEDVNDFLQRIKELGDKRDQEDEERNRKLEEEILQGRAERQARRAERARSISPTKSSPATTPTARTPTQSVAPIEILSPTRRDKSIDDATDQLTGSSPTKENSVPERSLSIKPTSPSSAMPSRNSPLSWQRRPESQASDRPRSRPLSMVATENAARSPRATPAFETDSEPTLTREQIAQSLAFKDPKWFRQTADRGLNSPAYRRNQVEDVDRSDHGSHTSRGVQMPGMATKTDTGETDRPTSPARLASRSRGSVSSGLGSPIVLTSAQRFDPPTPQTTSPALGRSSPDRMDRPPSPTKGMGGFVQSAMMKRSDSVSKRWSVTSPTGLTRGNSIASNRNSVDPSILASPPRDSSPKPPSRPTSSHSNAAVTQELHRPSTPSSMRSSMTTSMTNDKDGFAKPGLPASRSQTSLDKAGDDVSVEATSSGPETPVPSSPSRTMDPKRWSPTKSSWLESALNKPDTPKPKPAPAVHQQPAWMAEIAKAKQKSGSVDLGRSTTIKHEVKVGGLMRSPPPGGLSKPVAVGGLPAGFTAGLPRKGSVTTPTGSLNSTPVTRTPRSGSIDTPSPGDTRAKPDTPPKKDFRSVLKSRQLLSENTGKDEPEFKNVFGSLKKAQTQNYVAPDELKNNITRGKMALNVTGGPKKTERKDEFKEAILKKKEDFKNAQAEGKGVTRTGSIGSIGSASPIPEALMKRQSLTRSGSVSSVGADAEIDTPARKPSLQKETVTPARLQIKDSGIGGKLAGRLNPALAGLLARGPPSASSDVNAVPSLRPVSTNASAGSQDRPANGPQLTHMTKGRARGPKRKAPSAVAPSDQSAAVTSISPKPKETESASLDTKPSNTGEPLVKLEERKPSTPTESEAAEQHAVEPVEIKPVLLAGPVEALKSPIKSAETGLASPTKSLEPVEEVRPPIKSIETGQVSPSKKTMEGMKSPTKSIKTSLASPTNSLELVEVVKSPTKSIKTGLVSPSKTPEDAKSPIHSIKTGPASPVMAINSPPKSPLKPVEIPPTSPAKAPTGRPRSPTKVASIAEALKSPRSPKKADAEGPTSQPSSPRKLDMKRRSQFLQEAPNQNNKTEPQLEAPKPLSPAKLANAFETPLKPQESFLEPVEISTPQTKIEAPVTSPLLPPKVSQPYSVPSPSAVSPVTPKLTPAPLSPVKTKVPVQIETTSKDNDTTAKNPSEKSIESPRTKPDVDSEPVVSVKSARALWDSSASAGSTANPPRARSPIKLPTEEITAESQASVVRSSSPVKKMAIAKEIATANETKSSISVLQPIVVSNRPLPTVPTKGQFSPPSSAGLMPSASPTRSTDSPVPQTSEASTLLENFFVDRKAPPPYKVDTTRVLSSRPVQGQVVKSLQSAMYQLLADGKKQLVPSHQERFLFEGNMYLCIHCFETSAGKKLTEAYFWVGDDVPTATADMTNNFAQKEAKAAGAKLLKLQQGKETSEFIQALGGIIVVRRGSANKYDSLAPHILCGRSFFGQIAFDEVDFTAASLCSGFVYLISAPNGKAYLWKGKGCGIDELSCARLLGMDFGLTGEIEEVEDGSEPTSFLDLFGFGAQIPKSADHWRLKPNYSKYCGRLFCASGSGKAQARTSFGSQLFGSAVEQIVEVSPFNQADISPSNIYILDAFFEIYVIVGARSQSQYAAFHNALMFASEYGILAASMEDRPFVPITNCVMEGIPKDLKALFRKWTDGLTPTIVQSPTTPLGRGRSLRIVPLTAALEAMKS